MEYMITDLDKAMNQKFEPEDRILIPDYLLKYSDLTEDPDIIFPIEYASEEIGIPELNRVYADDLFIFRKTEENLFLIIRYPYFITEVEALICHLNMNPLRLLLETIAGRIRFTSLWIKQSC